MCVWLCVLVYVCECLSVCVTGLCCVFLARHALEQEDVGDAIDLDLMHPVFTLTMLGSVKWCSFMQSRFCESCPCLLPFVLALFFYFSLSFVLFNLFPLVVIVVLLFRVLVVMCLGGDL